VIRPSGTEPKLKAYLEVVEPVADGDVPPTRTRAAAALQSLRAEAAAALGLG
jgi:phosphomannomutase